METKKVRSLRLLALWQLIRTVGRYVADRLYALAGAKRVVEVQGPGSGAPIAVTVVPGLSLCDVRVTGEAVLHVLRTGHVSTELFAGVTSAELPRLGQPEFLGDSQNVLQTSLRFAESYAGMGFARSGYLPQYVRAQVEHVHDCESCQSAVCAAVREGQATYAVTQDVLRQCGFGPKVRRLH